MNSSIKSIAQKMLYGGVTKGLYERASQARLKKTYQMSDEEYIKYRYKERLGKYPDLDNPKTLTEKLNWLKLHQKNPDYTYYVDKYEVKKIIANKIGEEHVIKCFGVWDDFDEIDFNALPEKFVLKRTGDSGGQVICTDKDALDRNVAKKALAPHEVNYFYVSREYPYRDVKPRILAEEYIDSLGHTDSMEYKVTCFNGKVKFITVCRGRAHGSFDERTNDHYDLEGNILPFYASYKNAIPPMPLPKQTDELVKYSEIIAKEMPYVRVDWYISNDVVLFGEITFFTWGGFIDFTPREWDEKLGKDLVLPPD